MVSHCGGRAGGAWGRWAWDRLWLRRLPTWPLVWSGQIHAAMPGTLFRGCPVVGKSSLRSGLGTCRCSNSTASCLGFLGGGWAFLSAETLLCLELALDKSVGSSQGRRGAIRPVESRTGLVFQPQPRSLRWAQFHRGQSLVLVGAGRVPPPEVNGYWCLGPLNIFGLKL